MLVLCDINMVKKLFHVFINDFSPLTDAEKGDFFRGGRGWAGGDIAILIASLGGRSYSFFVTIIF